MGKHESQKGPFSSPIGARARAGDFEFCLAPQFRGQGLGRRLAKRIIGEAREIGYNKLRLDTVERKMKTAVRLYQQLGFGEIRPYRSNPLEGTLYIELDL